MIIYRCQLQKNDRFPMFRKKQQLVDKKVCPFDSNHIVQPRRFPSHLITCKSTNRHLYVSCRYNKLHYIKIAKKAQHQQNCQSRVYEERPVLDKAAQDQDGQSEKAIIVQKRKDKDKEKSQKKIIEVDGQERQKIVLTLVQSIVQCDPIDKQQVKQQWDVPEEYDQVLSQCSSCMNFLSLPENQQKIKSNPKLSKYLRQYQEKKQCYQILQPEEGQKSGKWKSKKIHK